MGVLPEPDTGPEGKHCHSQTPDDPAKTGRNQDDPERAGRLCGHAGYPSYRQAGLEPLHEPCCTGISP